MISASVSVIMNEPDTMLVTSRRPCTTTLFGAMVMSQEAIPARKPRQDLAGRQFGQLVVLGKSNRTDNGRNFPFWLCRCECGTEKDVDGAALKSGLTKSCGCGRAANFRTDGLHTRYRREYAVWQQAIQRCHNPTAQGYGRYGARGIEVCDRWRSSFAAFIEDMGPRPGDDLSLDREDNDGNYEAGNCRWATRVQQCRNMRSNHVIEHDGRTLTVIEWSEATGIRQDVIGSRLKRGWTVAEALTTRPGERRRARDSKGRYAS
jgi:hypothetical protein